MLAAQHSGDLVGSDPFCAVMPEKVDDPSDAKLAKQVEKLVQNEIAESRMTFKGETKQVLRLSFMPVHSMHKFDDAGKNRLIQRSAHQHMNPAGFAVTVKAVKQLPFARAFLDH